ncbi:MAG TPA: amino acid ABC transporter permease [Acidimicrobiales bacterium]|nr:amino acid ABC transporter permease [Acidimicrobiales bacterium]
MGLPGAKTRRAADEAPWWDTFPWWAVLIGLIIAWMGQKVLFSDDYAVAWERISPGVWLTIKTTLYSFGLAFVLGLITGLGRISRFFVFRNLARTYVEFIRGIPMLVLIFTIALVVVPQVSESLGRENSVSPEWRAIIALALIYGGYMAEIFRGGIQAIPKGQMEAGRSLGMSRGQTMKSIILPQAMRIIIPPLGNDFIAILKDTSLLSVLGILEVTQLARQYASSTFKFREGYLVTSFIYLLLTVALSLMLAGFEYWINRDRRGER